MLKNNKTIKILVIFSFVLMMASLILLYDRENSGDKSSTSHWSSTESLVEYLSDSLATSSPERFALISQKDMNRYLNDVANKYMKILAEQSATSTDNSQLYATLNANSLKEAHSILEISPGSLAESNYTVSNAQDCSGCHFYIKTLPVAITQSGNWCLADNLDAQSLTQNAITILVDNVVLDGKNRHIRGPISSTTTLRGITGTDVQNLTVKNLRLSGFHTAILIADTTPPPPQQLNSRAITIENVIVENPSFQGIHIKGDGVKVQNCSIVDVGPNTTTPNSFATAILLTGSGCLIEGNYMRLGQAQGNGENVGIGLYWGAGCRIANNTILFNTWLEWARNFGVWVQPRPIVSVPVVENNIVANAHYPFGPFGLYRNNVASEISCAPYITRPHPVLGKTDAGGNIFLFVKDATTAENGACPDNTDYAEKRFYEKPNANSAYSVFVAHSEKVVTPIPQQQKYTIDSAHYVPVAVWAIVASHYGHQTLQSEKSIESQLKYLTPEDQVKAKSIAERIINGERYRFE